MQQSPPNQKKKKKLIKIRLQQISSLHQSTPSHGTQRGQPPPSQQPTMHAPPQQQVPGHPSAQRPSTQQSTLPPQRKSRRTRSSPSTAKRPWHEQPVVFLIRALVVFGLIAVIGSATHGTFSFSSNSATVTSQEPASTVTTPPTPTQLAWIPTYTFSGTGTQKTDPFTIGNDWHIVWSCDPASLHGQDYLVIIEVDAPDGHIVDSGVNTMCTQKHKQDVYKVHVTGRVYLHIITLGDWSVQVEELTEAGIFERVGSHT